MARILHFIVLAAICAGGAWIQWQEHYELSGIVSTWGFVLSLFPYVLCTVVAFRSESVIPAIAGATFALFVDGIAHYDIFVRQTGFSALLGFLFVPLLSTLVFVSLTMLITRAILRRREAKRVARLEERREAPRKLEPRLR